MPETTARVAAALLAATFAWAGIAKLVAYQAWSGALAGYRFPPFVERLSRPLVPVLELIVAVLIVTNRTRAGAALTLALVALFSFAVMRGRALHGDRLPCGCFGGREERSATAMLWRNVVLTVLAVAVLTAAREPVLFEGFAAPTGGEVVAAVLVAIGIAAAAWMGWQVAGLFRRRQAP